MYFPHSLFLHNQSPGDAVSLTTHHSVLWVSLSALISHLSIKFLPYPSLKPLSSLAPGRPTPHLVVSSLWS